MSYARPAAWLLFALAVAHADHAAARTRVAGVFGAHMVLQRDAEAPVWGWAEPGEVVKLSIAGQEHEAKANSAGRWVARLKPMQAGGPYELTVRGEDNAVVTLSDVLVGEVWLCSGQSNMAMTVARAADSQREIAAGEHPQIRMFTVPRRAAAEPQEDTSSAWVVASPATVGNFSAAAYYFGRMLHQELDVPVGLIHTSVGGTAVEAWTSLDAQQAVEELQPVLNAWENRPEPKAANARQAASLAKNRPAALYNGMIAPLAPYAIRGAIWYQGERNSRALSELYGRQLMTLIRDWRRLWNQGDFSFYVVQLPNYTQRQAAPVEENGWVLVREGAMLAAAKTPNAAIAVTTDIGEAGDIHPKNKQDVGKRLALLALAKDYGKDVEYSGPIFKSAEKKGQKVIVRFEHAEGLHARLDADLGGFALRGKDGDWVWASPKIVGKAVELTNPLVSDPQAVRYNWAPNPVGNLVNESGLPAAPFRVELE
ncbi:MAG: sialate O-acetylesterase [Planctomycetes bacterium]|nr:sialate O-acetylesterase [Planctomycetota bacterium]